MEDDCHAGAELDPRVAVASSVPSVGNPAEERADEVVVRDEDIERLVGDREHLLGELLGVRRELRPCLFRAVYAEAVDEFILGKLVGVPCVLLEHGGHADIHVGLLVVFEEPVALEQRLVDGNPGVVLAGRVGVPAGCRDELRGVLGAADFGSEVVGIVREDASAVPVRGGFRERQAGTNLLRPCYAGVGQVP